jgi:hypothetical protein
VVPKKAERRPVPGAGFGPKLCQEKLEDKKDQKLSAVNRLRGTPLHPQVRMESHSLCFDTREIRIGKVGARLSRMIVGQKLASFVQRRYRRFPVLIWSDVSSLCVCFVGKKIMCICWAALSIVEGASATVDHSDIRGSKPHSHDPSGAASD